MDAQGTSRMQFSFPKERADIIEQLGTKLKMSQVKVAGLMLEIAMDTEDSTIAFVVWRLGMMATAPLRGVSVISGSSGVQPGDMVPMQVPVEKPIADRIDALAQRMQITQATLCARILDRAIDDNKWLIDALTSRLAQVLLSPVKKAAERRKHPTKPRKKK